MVKTFWRVGPAPDWSIVVCCGPEAGNVSTQRTCQFFQRWYLYNMKNKKTVDQLIRYLLIGALTAMVDFAVLYFLGVYLSCNVIFAAAIAFLTALIVHFSMNKYYNFKNFDRTSITQLRTYTVVTMLNFTSTIFFMHVFINFTGITIIPAKVLTALINTSWGFPAQKFLTFGIGIRATGSRIFKETMQKHR